MSIHFNTLPHLLWWGDVLICQKCIDKIVEKTTYLNWTYHTRTFIMGWDENGERKIFNGTCNNFVKCDASPTVYYQFCYSYRGNSVDVLQVLLLLWQHLVGYFFFIFFLLFCLRQIKNCQLHLQNNLTILYSVQITLFIYYRNVWGQLWNIKRAKSTIT